MVMAGNSRLAYHAVPRVLAPNDKEPIPLCLEPCKTKAAEELKETSVSSCDKCERSNETRSKDTETPCKRTKYDIEEISLGCAGNSSVLAEETVEAKLLRKYLSMSRININIRQVLAPGKTFPS